jgi:hypothetical protein
MVKVAEGPVGRVWVAARGQWGSSVPVACLERTAASDRGWYRWRYCMGAVKHGLRHGRFPQVAYSYTLELSELPAPLRVSREVLALEGTGDELAALALTGGVNGPSPWEVYPVQREIDTAEGRVGYELRFYLRPPELRSHRLRPALLRLRLNSLPRGGACL